MPEGFQCDKCKRFIKFEGLKYRIQHYSPHLYRLSKEDNWKTELTFCEPCYRMTLDFLKVPHVFGSVI